jgi:DNA repair protein RadC
MSTAVTWDHIVGNIQLDPSAPKAVQRRVHELQRAYSSAKALAATGSRGRSCRTPEDVYAVMRPLIGDLIVEELHLIVLDPGKNVKGIVPISRGDIDGTEAGVSLILRHLLIAGGKSGILCHNHPSGSPTISDGDIGVTRNVVRGAKTVDCTIDDHIVIPRWADNGVSLRRDRPDLWS